MKLNALPPTSSNPKDNLAADSSHVTAPDIRRVGSSEQESIKRVLFGYIFMRDTVVITDVTFVYLTRGV